MTGHGLAITVGVDSSPSGSAAVCWAAEQAHLRRAPLHLVSAYHWPVAGARGVTEDRELGVMLQRAAQDALDHARDRSLASWPDLFVTEEAVEGDPAAVLVARTADSHSVVVGTPRAAGRPHGVGALATTVAALALGPAVVVPAAWRSAAPGGAIVAGVGPHRPPAAALAFAFEAARVSRRPLRLVVCSQFGPRDGGESGPSADAFAAALPAAVVGEVAEFARRFPDVQVRREVLVGRPAATLAWAAQDAQLLVVGRHRDHGPLRRLFGSTTTGALERAACPVAVIPDLERVELPEPAIEAVPARDFWAADYGLSTGFADDRPGADT